MSNEGRVWRWIVEAEPVDPVENMARDADLLKEMIDFGDGTVPAVRIYRWSMPAVTYGRLQQEDDVRGAFPNLPLVRRPTGGRAVLHGEDLTVTVAARDEWLPGTTGSVMSSYLVIVSGIIDTLSRHGIEAAVGDRRERKLRVSGSVDCFASIAVCDISNPSTGEKLVGSAQRRENGAVLQQMSIHVDALKRLSNPDRFIGDLRECLAASLNVGQWQDV